MRQTIRRSVRAIAVTLLLGLVAGAGAAVVGAGPAHATLPGMQGEIYTSGFGPTPGIYRTTADGAGQQQLVPGVFTQTFGPLTFTMGYPRRPAVSPDGSILLFDAIVRQGVHPASTFLNDTTDTGRELFAMRLIAPRVGQIDRLLPGHIAFGADWRPTATDGSIAYSGETGFPGPIQWPANAVHLGRVIEEADALFLSGATPISIINTERVSDVEYSPDGTAISYTSMAELPGSEPGDHQRWEVSLHIRSHFSTGFDHVIRTDVPSSSFSLPSPEFLGIQTSWAPDGRRLLVDGKEVVSIDPATWTASGGSYFLLGSERSNEGAVFAPSNDPGTPGDTFAVPAGGLYILTASATEARIRGPLGSAAAQDAFWWAQPPPLLLGLLAVDSLPALQPLVVPPKYQPKTIVGQLGLQTCKALPALC